MRNLVKLLLALALSAAAGNPAYALGRDANSEFQLNTASPNAMRTEQLGTQLIEGTIRTMKCQYSYARQGGKISAIILQTIDGENCRLPKNSVVKYATIDAITAAVGTSATISIGTGQSAADIMAATAITTFTTGAFDGLPFWTAATAIKITADTNPTMTIATTALTAGKFNVFISYVTSN
jgi:hypothetical protein